MTYRIYWDENQQNIIHAHLTDIVAWSEYNTMIDDVITEIHTVDFPVYFILKADAPQPQGNPLPHFRRTIDKFNHTSHLQLAISVDAGMATYLRICLDVIVKVYSPGWKNKIPFVKTMDDARRLIEVHQQEMAGQT